MLLVSFRIEVFQKIPSVFLGFSTLHLLYWIVEQIGNGRSDFLEFVFDSATICRNEQGTLSSCPAVKFPDIQGCRRRNESAGLHETIRTDQHVKMIYHEAESHEADIINPALDGDNSIENKKIFNRIE